ncbi:hypothetical protein V8D89_013392 [Ganoderma adspersum]
MSEPQMLPSRRPSIPDTQSEGAPDPSQFDAIVQAAFGDTARSSGSLESNSSSPSADRSSTGSSSTSQSVPSLVTTTSTSTTASAASSKTPSPCPSILRSNSAPPSSFPTLSSSTGSSPNVTFAPLPQTEPRKRNSSHPLGVAARSRLLRHRRMLRERGLNPDDYPYHYQQQQQQQQQYQYQQQYQQQYQYGYGSGVESGDPHPYSEDGAAVEFPEMHGEDGQEEHVRVRRARTMSDTGREGEEEDPFVALGKLVKGAGKTLWKSLSMRDMRAKEREAAKAKDKDKDKDRSGKGAGAEKQPRTSEGGGSVQEKEAVPRRSIVGTGHLFDDDGAAPRRASEEGGVWEEEVTEDSWKKLLSKSEPAPDTVANGDASDDGQATPTPASIEAADSTTVLTTIVVAQPSAKAR